MKRVVSEPHTLETTKAKFPACNEHGRDWAQCSPRAEPGGEEKKTGCTFHYHNWQI